MGTSLWGTVSLVVLCTKMIKLVLMTVVGLWMVYAMVPGVEGENFIPGRVHLIDYSNTTGNFLFRTNDPVLANGTYAYDELVETMTSVAAAAGISPFPSEFLIMDHSFLSPLLPAEDKDLKVAQDFFADNPDKGKLISWPLVGSLSNPNKVPSDLREALAKEFPHDDLDKLPSRVPLVNRMLNSSPAPIPIVIVVQCEAGVDRTGEFSGATYLQFGSYGKRDWTYAEVLKYNDGVENRPMSTTTANGLCWYCWYLKYSFPSTHGHLDCDLPH